MFVTRCFKVYRMSKRGGRAYEEGGMDSTALGQLAVPCPACPHDGVNLPEGWKDASPEEK